jgi:HD superfamily phosphohydrolase
MRTIKRIRTVLYGDQRVSSAELEVLHTPAMQRLYGLRQLGLADRIFIDASHSRLHHVVGVLRQVDKLVNAIIYNLRHSKRQLPVSSAHDAPPRSYSARELAQYVRIRRPVIRFIGLLHDLTHAPFGHTIEDEIKLVKTKHDDPGRQADAFFRLLCQLVAWLALEAHGPEWSSFPESLRPFLSQAATEDLPDASVVGIVARDLISGGRQSEAGPGTKLTPGYIAEMFAHLRYAMTALLHLEALHSSKLEKKNVPSKAEYPFQKVVRTALEGTQFDPLIKQFEFEPRWDAFMLDIVGNTVCADLLDYAGRDSHFAGLRLNYDPDRIAENFTLISHPTPSGDENSQEQEYEEEPSKDGANGDGRLRSPFEGLCLRTAISLVSHKYRTDVPSELMNLLNVRFYLYERVIYHPTKCAAGSMLGTALQILFRRENERGKPTELPKHLRFVGDDVFLHDIRAAVSFLENAISKIQDGTQIGASLIADLSRFDRVHNGLVPELLKVRSGQPKAEALREIRAGMLLLDRLMSRRYFRPIFRVMPGAKDETLEKGAEALATLFIQPDPRYRTEREIERKAGLPLGTITIHCPKRDTAKKIANVFLTKPAPNGGRDIVRKLNQISELDPETFGKHQAAVTAVEQMYRSMWRLNVYVAPEHMERWRTISKAAGQVIFEKADTYHVDRADREWPNDEDLKRELTGKMVPSYGDSVGEEDLTLFGETLGQIGEDLLSSDRLREISPDFYSPYKGLSAKGRKRLEDALVLALTVAGESATDASRKGTPALRADQVLTVVRTFFKRKPGKEDEDSFRMVYSSGLEELTEDSFEQIFSRVKTAVSNSKELDAKDIAHKGNKFSEFRELFADLYRRFGKKSGPLPGEDDE